MTRTDEKLTASWNAPAGATKYHITFSSDNGQSWTLAGMDYTATSIVFRVDNPKTYIVGVRAGNDAGWSGWVNSAPSGPFVPPPPSAVGSVSISRANGTVSASWDAVAGATRYHVTYTDDRGGSYPPVDGHDNWTSTSLTFSADNAQSYRVGVRAGNAGGWSAWVDSPTLGPWTLPPPDPNAGIIVQDADGDALSAISVPEGGEASYQVKLASQPTADVEVCIGIAVRDNDDADITFKGEAADVVSLKLSFTPDNWDTAQTVTLVAAEDHDQADGARDLTHDAREYYSGKVDITAAEVDNDHAVVTAARGDDGDTASVSWTAYDGGDFSYYRVIVCADEQYDGNSCSGTVYKSDPIFEVSSTGPLSVTGLDPATGYGVILQTWRTSGAFKSHATLVAGPAAPSGLTVTPSDGNLMVSWNAVSGATGYDVRSSADGSAWTTEHSNVSGTTVSVADAKGEIEQIGVRARNADGPGNWTTKQRMPDSSWLTTIQQSGASAQSAQGQSQLSAPATLTVTRANARDEKLYVSWDAVTGASGYNVACSYSGWSDIDGSGWWHCGSTTSATSLTVDNDENGDLSNTRSFLVAVRAVTSNQADASDWKRSESVHPAHRWLSNLTHSRSGGSITLSWTPNPWTTGYEVDCAVSGSSYTRCATLTGQDDTAAQHSVTLSSWTVGSNTYSIDDGATYDIKITSTNQWGKSAIGMLPPLIGPIPNVSNLGEASDGFGQEVKLNPSAAVGFTTGDNSGGYSLKGVTIGFLAPSGGRAPNSPLSVAIHAEASDDDPAISATYTLSLVSGDPKTAGNATWSCSGTCSLSKDTTYFLVLTTSSTNAYKWDTTASGNQTNSANFGWEIDDGMKVLSSADWSDVNWVARFRVSATPK